MNDGHNRRICAAKESISGLETKPEETTQNKEGETKWWKIKKKRRETDREDRVRSEICVIGVPEEGESMDHKMLKDTVAENFPKWRSGGAK